MLIVYRNAISGYTSFFGDFHGDWGFGYWRFFGKFGLLIALFYLLHSIQKLGGICKALRRYFLVAETEVSEFLLCLVVAQGILDDYCYIPLSFLVLFSQRGQLSSDVTELLVHYGQFLFLNSTINYFFVNVPPMRFNVLNVGLIAFLAEVLIMAKHCFHQWRLVRENFLQPCQHLPLLL